MVYIIYINIHLVYRIHTIYGLVDMFLYILEHMITVHIRTSGLLDFIRSKRTCNKNLLTSDRKSHPTTRSENSLSSLWRLFPPADQNNLGAWMSQEVRINGL